MGTGELTRALKASCFKQLFPIIRSLYGEFRRCALVGRGWLGTTFFEIGVTVAIGEIVISRLACTQLCECLRKALGWCQSLRVIEQVAAVHSSQLSLLSHLSYSAISQYHNNKTTRWRGQRVVSFALCALSLSDDDGEREQRRRSSAGGQRWAPEHRRHRQDQG
jgi:hypothetical protein